MAPLTGSTSVKSYALRGACRQWRGFADAGSDRQLGHIAWSAGVLDSALALPPWLGHHIMSSVLAQGSARRALQPPMHSRPAWISESEVSTKHASLFTMGILEVSRTLSTVISVDWIRT